MTRTISLPSIPLFLLAAAVVATLAFGITRYLVDDANGALPPIEVAGDAAAARPGALDINKVFEARVDTTVSINAMVGDEPINGAGVVVSKDGTIVTASHVIKDYKLGREADTIVVRFFDRNEVEAELVAIDQFTDIAILKVDPSQIEGGVQVAPLAKNSEQVMVGSEVLAIGAPFGYDWTASPGHVSAKGGRLIGSRINLLSDIPGAIQFDASINTGNSGGPLFNARGEVIGISQQIATPTKASAGVAFAVPSNLILRAVRIHQATGATQIPYAELGIDTHDVSPQLAKAAGLAVSHGAIVQNATGPASIAGVATGRPMRWLGEDIKLGDVVVELAGRPVTSSEDFERIAGLIDAEAPVKIEFMRGSKRMEATIDPETRQIV